MLRMIVGVSGASGIILAEYLLRALQRFPQVESHLVMTQGAMKTLQHESTLAAQEFSTLANRFYPHDDLGADIASGTYITAGMAVVPCSMKTLAGIVHGYSDNLLLRAADVCLKERRKLVLAPRETPLSTLHLENMLKASQLGAVVLPPVLTFYHHPQTVDELVQAVVWKILQQFGLDAADFLPWTGGMNNS